MYSDFNIKLGLYLKNARKNKAMTQEELGKAVGKSKAWYVDIERGKNNLYFDDAKKLAYVLGFTLDELANFVSSE
jgi:transcriptional regulator with XRE-family HTH domain